MTPEDVLLEAIAAASIHGDSAYLRELECQKLRDAMKRCAHMFHVERDDGGSPAEAA